MFILIAILALLVAAHLYYSGKLAVSQANELARLCIRKQLEAIEAGDSEATEFWAKLVFSIDIERHYKDLRTFRSPWNRYPAAVRLALGQV